MNNILERNKLIENYLPLAKKIVKQKRIPSFISKDEVLSAAYFGLIDAAIKYNPDFCSFGTYARIRIEGQIKDYLRKLNKNNIRESESLYFKDENSQEIERFGKNDVDDATEFLEDAVKNLDEVDKVIFTMYYGDGASLKEIGNIINLSESRVSQILKKSRNIVKEYLGAA